MEKKRLLYDHQAVFVAVKQAEKLAAEMSLNFNREFIDYHNDVCPGCRKAMKLERHSNTVKSVGTFSMGVYEDDLKMIIPYVLCKSCAKNTLKPNINVADSAEAYLLETLKLV